MDRRAFFLQLFHLPVFFGLNTALHRSTDDTSSIVGTWDVTVVGAPFAQHLFTFHKDNTMIQVNPDAGDSRTSDSDGLGMWKVIRGGIQGSFKEINADRNSHQFVSSLIVTFSLNVHNGSTFIGPAVAVYYRPDGSVMERHEATLHGTRMRLGSFKGA